MRLSRRGAAGRLAAAALAATALLAAGCSGGDDDPPEVQAFEFSGPAANVDGREIPAQEIADQLQVYRAVPGAADIALQVDALTQEGSEQPTPEAVADILNTEVSVTAIQAELARRNLSITPNTLDVAGTTVRSRFNALADQLPPEFLQRTIERYAAFVTLDQELAPKYSDEELRAEYTRNPTNFERTCVRQILVERPEEADAIVAELAAGANFDQLARTRSLDPTAPTEGADIGCVPRGSFVDAFEKAAWEGPVGVVQPPVRSEYGVHVLEVTRRGLFPFEEVREDVIATLSALPFTSLGIWLQLNLPKAQVSVDPRYGVWDAKAGRVLPRGTTSEGITLRPDEGETSTTGAPAPEPTSTTAGR